MTPSVLTTETPRVNKVTLDTLLPELTALDTSACVPIWMHSISMNKPGIPLGMFALRAVPMLCASDTWLVVFRGPGGHGGSGAHLSIDPTLAAARFISALQTIVSRNVPAMEYAVLSIGHIQAGDANAPNVIPDSVRIKGTGRSYSP